MYKIIVPVLNPNIAEDMVHLAHALAGTPASGKQNRVRITVLGVVTVPADEPLSNGMNLVKAYRTMLRYIPPEINDHIEVRTEVRVAREVWQGIVEQVQEENANLLLLHWKGNTQTPGAVYGSTIDTLMRNQPCDMVLAYTHGLKPIKNILIPVRGSGYNSLTFKLSGNMAEAWKANITVLHSLSQLESGKPPAPTITDIFPPPFVDPYGPDDSYTMPSLLHDLPSGARLLTLHGDPTDSIVNEAVHYDLLVIGASGVSDKNIESETMAIRLARRLEVPMLVVKATRPPEVGKPAAPHREDDRLVELVDQWFAQNTFRYREFRSMSSLTLLKELNNLTISLVFPVYGKVQPVTLADSIRRARISLMRDCAMVDEIIISAPGAQFDRDEINLLGVGESPDEEVIYLPGDHPYQPDQSNGPGDALWHALRRVRGDIVVWADPGISGFEPRHIYGLIGPLLSYQKFNLAIGFFTEGEENEAHPVEDALNELSIRPLLGGFFPRLSGVINPTSLIGAARRDHLERLALFTESGLMPGLLIDTLSRSGLMSMVQVDLGAPAASVCAISPQRTSYEIMTVLLRRVEERAQIHLTKLFNSAVKTVHKGGGVYFLRVSHSHSPVRELPPQLYTPGYFRHTF